MTQQKGTPTNRSFVGHHSTGGCMSPLNSLIDKVDMVEKKLMEYPFVVNVSNALEIRPLFVTMLAVALVFLFLGFLSQFISYLVGYVYPAWMSCKTIEKRSVDDSLQWLAYWSIFSGLTFIEIFGDVFLFWVPFYYILKVVFLLWLSLPQFRGAYFLYENFIRKLINDYCGKVVDS